MSIAETEKKLPRRWSSSAADESLPSPEWVALRKRADASDAAALAEVRATFDQAPEKWQSIGSSFRNARYHVVETAMALMRSDSAVEREAARR